MIQLPRHDGFVLKAAHELGIASELRLDHLEGVGFIQQFMVGFVDDGHAAFAQARLDAVLAMDDRADLPKGSLMQRCAIAGANGVIVRVGCRALGAAFHRALRPGVYIMPISAIAAQC